MNQETLKIAQKIKSGIIRITTYELLELAKGYCDCELVENSLKFVINDLDNENKKQDAEIKELKTALSELKTALNIVIEDILYHDCLQCKLDHLDHENDENRCNHCVNTTIYKIYDKYKK